MPNALFRSGAVLVEMDYGPHGLRADVVVWSQILFFETNEHLSSSLFIRTSSLPSAPG